MGGKGGTGKQGWGRDGASSSDGHHAAVWLLEVTGGGEISTFTHHLCQRWVTDTDWIFPAEEIGLEVGV